jgi:hypothetical protein
VSSAGLLLAFTNPPEGDEAAFNAWYDEEHAPARLSVPDIFSARRYVAGGADSPRYMACYDLETPEVLQRPEYVRLLAGISDRERAMLARLPLLDKHILRTVIDADEWTSDLPYALTVAMTPREGTEAEFAAWYGTAHIPVLRSLAGWRRLRLFEQVEGAGAPFIALHELESASAPNSEAYRAALSELASRCASSPEVRLYTLLRSFTGKRRHAVVATAKGNDHG